MFKFLKSKKGFTLVELMIVVVIMAILVAVAVPIYSAVTANARKKTCVNNQRDIVAAINTKIMNEPGKVYATVEKTIVITTNDSGDGEKSIVDNGVFSKETDNNATEFRTLFNKENMPFCPEKGSVLTIKVIPNGDSYTITPSCSKDHVAATPDAPANAGDAA